MYRITSLYGKKPPINPPQKEFLAEGKKVSFVRSEDLEEYQRLFRLGYSPELAEAVISKERVARLFAEDTGINPLKKYEDKKR